MRIPVATYRVQFNGDFRFQDAIAIVPHLHRLGISHIYASPIFAARAGSTHGYDVVDPNRLNPELGTAGDFEALIRALHDRRMGLLLDIVPNHMAASPENQWWMDVLENGSASPYASYFGINWGASGSREQDKIFLPILGEPYGRVLDKGELKLSYEQAGFFVNYYAHRLPIGLVSYTRILKPNSEPLLAIPDYCLLLESLDRLPPRTANEWEALESRYREKDLIKERLWSLVQQYSSIRDHVQHNLDAIGVDELDEIVQEQAYRIAFWKVATERINYRRFFDVSDLIGMRVEDPSVFQASHRLALELVHEGAVNGLRIDHIDGLADPLGYQKQLVGEDVYIVAEKILEADEELPSEWPIQGTTGYDFLGQMNSLFVEPAGLDRLTAYYQGLTASTKSFHDVTYERKAGVIASLFAGEMQDLGAHLAMLAEEDRNARDLSPRDITQAIIEVTSCLSVYRTYVDSFDIRPADFAYVRAACEEARRRNPDVDALVYDFVERVLTLRFKRWMSEASQNAWLAFVKRWQQLSGPIMAKGVEDSAMYVYNRLISMNEVGGVAETRSSDQFHSFLGGGAHGGRTP